MVRAFETLLVVVLAAASECAADQPQRPRYVGRTPTPAPPATAAPSTAGKGPAGPCRLKAGFRDLSWDSPPTKEMVFLRNDDRTTDVRVLRRPSDKLRIGTATVSVIEYHYFKNRLASVEIRARRDQLQLLAGGLEAAWGEPTLEVPPNAVTWGCPPGDTNKSIASLLFDEKQVYLSIANGSATLEIEEHIKGVVKRDL